MPGVGELKALTFAIVAMWRHGELGSSTRRIVAMNKMQELQCHGDAAKWKLDFIGKAREVYSSKLSIEHFVLRRAVKTWRIQECFGMCALRVESS